MKVCVFSYNQYYDNIRPSTLFAFANMLPNEIAALIRFICEAVPWGTFESLSSRD